VNVLDEVVPELVNVHFAHTVILYLVDAAYGTRAADRGGQCDLVLASPASTMVTGHVLAVDGGFFSPPMHRPTSMRARLSQGDSRKV